ncbi:transposase [Breznakiellaceae bacterium SP9]
MRQHHSIENRQCWPLDMSFVEDSSRLRKDHALENLDILRKIALNRLRSTNMDKKLSAKRKQFRTAINQDFMHTVLFG